MNDKLAYVEYSSNNSGGGWWLTDDDWKTLEAAGWEVNWVATDTGRWLDALATSAIRREVTMREAVEEFQRLTEQDVTEEGCTCCGPPHNFTGFYDSGKAVPHYP